MKATVAHADALVRAVQHAAQGRHASVALTATEDGLTVTGRVPGMARSFDIDATVHTPGSATVSARAAIALLAGGGAVPVRLMLDEEADELGVTCGSTTRGYLSTDVPGMLGITPGPEVTWCAAGSVHRLELDALVATVAPAAEKEGLHAVLGGVHLAIDASGGLLAEASDRYLHARRVVPFRPSGDGRLDVIAPSAGLASAAYAMSRVARETYVDVATCREGARSWVRFTTPTSRVVLEVLDGTYPTMPPAPAAVAQAELDVTTTITHADRLAVVSDRCTLRITRDGAVLRATGGLGELQHEVACVTGGAMQEAAEAASIPTDRLIAALETFFKEDVADVEVSVAGHARPIALRIPGDGTWTVTIATRRELQR